MLSLRGKSVTGGGAIGELFFLSRETGPSPKRVVGDIEAEVSRFKTSAREAADELRGLYEESVGKIGEEGAQIFQLQAMMIEDEDFLDAVLSTIKGEMANAEYAVAVAAGRISGALRSSGVEYIGERSADLDDIACRIVARLSGKRAAQVRIPDGAVLAAGDFSPSEIARLDLGKVVALITREGSTTSHAAILARSLGIPALMGLGDALLDSYAGMTAIVDGDSGLALVDPVTDTLERWRSRLADAARAKEGLRSLVGKANSSQDGTRVEIHANIGKPADVEAALENDAGGIGLFRSEFLFLERHSLPSEEEQYEAYRSVLERMGNKRVVIRTLDIGADKQVDYLGLPEEANPALGLRAIRLCLARPGLFTTQLKALLRASIHGRLCIMFPMISSVDEVRRAKAILDGVKAELKGEGIAYAGGTEIGVMVETPAAAIMSDALAAEVDFFSIGTNDLTQYTLAVDRENVAVSSLYNPRHEAVLRLIEMTVKNAHAHGIWAGVCGELAADTDMTEGFLRIGVDELSVASPRVLPLRKRVTEIDLRKQGR